LAASESGCASGAEASLGWRDEIRTVLEERVPALGGERGGEGWQRVGTARTMDWATDQAGLGS
jgi:hypothetical protein